MDREQAENILQIYGYCVVHKIPLIKRGIRDRECPECAAEIRQHRLELIAEAIEALK